MNNQKTTRFRQNRSATLTQQPVCKEARKINFLNLAYLPLFLVFCYLYGYSFSVGYFDHFSIDADHFSRSYEGYATKTLIGYLGLLGFIKADIANFYVLMCFTVAVTCAAFVYLILRIEPKISLLLAKQRSTKLQVPQPNANWLLSIQASCLVFVGLFSPVVLFFASLLFLIYGFFPPYFVGQKVAENLVELANKTDCLQSFSAHKAPAQAKGVSCIKVLDPENKLRIYGAEIAVSENKIAVYEKGKVSIIWLKDGFTVERLVRN